MRSKLSMRLNWSAAPGDTENILPLLASPFAVAEAAPAAAAAVPEMLGHDPLLAAHDEAVFLLHTAAEIEHALMVQYLYASFSLLGSPAPATKQTLVGTWSSDILTIAEEEMGHLASVQNMLRLIGGPITFERADFPFRNDLYPFHFRLEPLTKDSLARYVFAEMPTTLGAADLTTAAALLGKTEAEVTQMLADIMQRANKANDGAPANHVGTLYDRIEEVFRKATSPADAALHLADEDFDPTTVDFQAGPDWNKGHENILIHTVTQRSDTSGANPPTGALELIEAIKTQGEGVTADTMQKSHFIRFLKIYADFPAAGDPAWSGGRPARDIPVNPNTTTPPLPANGPKTDPPSLEQGIEALMELQQQPGRITHPLARLWAQFFNLRYRILLASLSHFWQTNDAAARVLVEGWAFTEMHNLKKLSRDSITTLPLHKEDTQGPPFAGPPFELDYTLNLSIVDRGRWLMHRDLRLLAATLLDAIEKEAAAEGRTVDVSAWRTKDKEALTKIQQQLGSAPGPVGPGPVVPTPVEPAPVVPAPAGTTSFAADILPLFRPVDITHMKPFGVDLDDFAFMSQLANAQDVLGRLDASGGSIMPPDKPWPQSQIDLFKKWIDEGMKP